MHCAAAAGNVALIALLISMAGDDDKRRQLLREKNGKGETCLHEAVRCGKRNAVERLVEEDVKVSRSDSNYVLLHIDDKEGVSPLYLATTLRQLEIVRFLTQQQRCSDVLYPTASYAGPGSKTALHVAVLLSKELSELLAKWKDELIDKADAFGSMTFHLLTSTKDRTIMKLLEMDATSGYRLDQEGSLPIHVASANGSRELVRLLSQRRPNCSLSCNNLGQTILHVAIQNGSSNVVDYVCSGQKFPRIFNIRDTDGNTALHFSVLQGSQLIFCRLIQRREVCLNFANKDERTPLDLAQLIIPPGISFWLKEDQSVRSSILSPDEIILSARRDIYGEFYI